MLLPRLGLQLSPVNSLVCPPSDRFSQLDSVHSCDSCVLLEPFQVNSYKTSPYQSFSDGSPLFLYPLLTFCRPDVLQRPYLFSIKFFSFSPFRDWALSEKRTVYASQSPMTGRARKSPRRFSGEAGDTSSKANAHSVITAQTEKS